MEKITNCGAHFLYPSPNIINITKSRRMRWAGHVERMGKVRNTYILAEDVNRSKHFEDPGTGG
jgi:hypothetical protein